MSKKKNHNHFKKASNQQEGESRTDNNHLYEDPFLGKKVELAQTANSVYNEKKQNVEENKLVVRPQSHPEFYAKPVLPGDDIKTETNIDDVVSSLSLNGKKKVVTEIFKNINEEKTDFDNKIKQNASEPKPTTLFDKIYTKEFVKSKRPGVFGYITDIFTSDIVWTSVAFALILGVILFYFQGLQPVVLSNYASKVNNQGNDLVTKYTAQVETYFTASNNVLQGYTYEQGVLCSTMKTFDNTAESLDQISRLQFSIFADGKLKTVENYSYFYNQEIKDEYAKLYSQYSTNLDRYQQPIKNLRDYARFLQFRNNLLKACGEIEVADQNLDKIKASCAGLLVQFTQFKEDGLPQFWDKIEKSVTDIETSCATLTKANQNNFIKSFFISFDDVIFYRPDSTDINEELTTINQDFVNQQRVNFKNRIDSIVENKSEIVNSFYFLGFEL